MRNHRRQINRRHLAIPNHHPPLDHQIPHPRRPAQDQGRHRVPRPRRLDAPQVPDRNIRTLSRLDRPAIVAPQHPRPAQRRDLQRLARAHRIRPQTDALQQHRLPRFGHQIARVVARRPIHAQPDLHPRIPHGPNRRDARPQPAIGTRAMRHPGAGAREQCPFPRIQLHTMRMPHIRPRPPQILRILPGATAEFRQ